MKLKNNVPDLTLRTVGMDFPAANYSVTVLVLFMLCALANTLKCLSFNLSSFTSI